MAFNADYTGEKYKDIAKAMGVENVDAMTLEDARKAAIDAVKKLSVILKIAEALDITGFGLVTDINSDILGDSVIMKTVVEGDPNFEIKYTMLCGPEFKKFQFQ